MVNGVDGEMERVCECPDTTASALRQWRFVNQALPVATAAASVRGVPAVWGRAGCLAASLAAATRWQ